MSDSNKYPLHSQLFNYIYIKLIAVNLLAYIIRLRRRNFMFRTLLFYILIYHSQSYFRRFIFSWPASVIQEKSSSPPGQSYYPTNKTHIYLLVGPVPQLRWSSTLQAQVIKNIPKRIEGDEGKESRWLFASSLDIRSWLPGIRTPGKVPFCSAGVSLYPQVERGVKNPSLGTVQSRNSLHDMSFGRSMGRRREMEADGPWLLAVGNWRNESRKASFFFFLLLQEGFYVIQIYRIVFHSRFNYKESTSNWTNLD